MSVDSFREMGCQVAPDLRTIASRCDLIITSLANDKAAKEVYGTLCYHPGLDAQSLKR